VIFGSDEGDDTLITCRKTLTNQEVAMKATIMMLIVVAFPMSTFAAGNDDDLAELTPIPLVPNKAKKEKKSQPVTSASPVTAKAQDEEDLAPLPPLKQKNDDSNPNPTPLNQPSTSATSAGGAAKAKKAKASQPSNDPPVVPLVLTDQEKAKLKAEEAEAEAKKIEEEARKLEAAIEARKLEAKKKAEAEAKAKAATDKPVLQEVIVEKPRTVQALSAEALEKGPTKTVKPASNSLTIAGVVVGGAGLVGIGLGTYFGVQAQSKYDSAKNANGTDRATFDASKKSAAENALSADISYVIGGVALATGITLIAIDVARRPAEPSKSVNVVFTGNGIGVTGSFQ